MSAKEIIEGWKNDGTLTLLTRFLPAFEGMKVSDERDFKKLEENPSGSKSNTKKTRKINRERQHR
jgi:hypothetical protein